MRCKRLQGSVAVAAGCQQVRDLLLNSNQAAFLRPLTGDATIFKELSADLQREEGGMRTTGWA